MTRRQATWERYPDGRVLVIVPCGRAKVWGADPDRGPTPARDACVGAPFLLNRAYAERFGDARVILSAKHGLVPPDFVIPGPYEVTFKRARTRPVEITTLREQVERLGLDRFPLVVGLGGREYRWAVAEAFALWGLRVAFPFAGLPIGEAMRAAKRAVASGDPGIGGVGNESISGRE